MKCIVPFFKIAICIALLLYLQPISAQTKKGGIYNLYFQVQDSLIKGAYAMEPEMLDSIKRMTENKMADILNAEIDCIYRLNKKGKPMTSVGVFGILESMPTSAFKNARNNYERDFYIKIDGKIDAIGGSSILLKSGRVSKIKPVVKLSILVYDKEKNLVWKKDVVRGDFRDLRRELQEESKMGRLLWKLFVNEDDQPDILQPVEILYMYMKTLDKV